MTYYRDEFKEAPVAKRKIDRCTGHCCMAFTLPMSPEEIWANYDRWARGGQPIVMSSTDVKLMPVIQDIHIIAPMVEYLGHLTKVPPRQIQPTNDELLGKPRLPNHFYRCKHFDAKKKICTIYEHRPAMCRNYPYGVDCNYAACTWKSHKRQPLTRKEKNQKRKKLRAEEMKKVDAGGGKK